MSIAGRTNANVLQSRDLHLRSKGEGEDVWRGVRRLLYVVRRSSREGPRQERMPRSFYKIEFELSCSHAENSETAKNVIHREIRPGNIDGSGNLE